MANVVSRLWDESKVRRDDEGKFARHAGTGGGGSLLAGLDFPSDTPTPDVQDSPSRHSTGRGMPSILAGTDLTVRGGKDISLDRHADGSYTLAANGATAEVPRDAMSNLKSALGYVATEDADIGDEGWVSRVNADGRRANFALIRKEANGRYSLRVAEGDRPSLDAVRNAPPVELNDRDVERLKDRVDRIDTAGRMDTGFGDLDMLLTDDKKFVLRHLGDDGRPVDVDFNAKSMAKIMRAIEVVADGFDEFNPDGPDDGVTQVDVSTNKGKVRVQLDGEWQGSSPEDRLRIVPVNGDDWGIIVAGDKQDQFTDVLSRLGDLGESEGFFERLNDAVT